MKNKAVTIRASFDLTKKFDIHSKQLIEHAAKFGGRDGDSGAGMGRRDMEFVFPNETSADKFMNSKFPKIPDLIVLD